MRLTDFLQGVGRYVMYYPALVNITGSVSATVFLSNLLSWEGSQEDTDGWIYKTREEMQEETGLTRHEQDHARRLLVAAGLMEEKRKGIPAKMHYRLNLDGINDAWEAHHSNKIAGKRQTALTDTGKAVDGESTDYLLTEETAEKTQDTVSPTILRIRERDARRAQIQKGRA